MAAKQGYLPPVSINEDMCSGCDICAASCPFTAIEFRIQNGKRLAHLIASLCQGWGVCGTACLSSVISANLFEDERLFSQIEAHVA